MCILGILSACAGLFAYGILTSSFYPPCFHVFVGSVNCNPDRHVGCVSEAEVQAYCDSGVIASTCTPRVNIAMCQTYEKCAVLSDPVPGACCPRAPYSKLGDCTVSRTVLDVDYSPGVYAFGSEHAFVFWVLGIGLLGFITLVTISLSFLMLHPNHRDATMAKMRRLCRQFPAHTG